MCTQNIFQMCRVSNKWFFDRIDEIFVGLSMHSNYVSCVLFMVMCTVFGVVRCRKNSWKFDIESKSEKKIGGREQEREIERVQIAEYILYVL